MNQIDYPYLGMIPCFKSWTGGRRLQFSVMIWSTVIEVHTDSQNHLKSVILATLQDPSI